MGTPTDREFGVLQQRVDQHSTRIKELEDRIDEHYDQLKEQLYILVAESTKQKGFIAGMVFLGTCIGAVLGVFKDYIIGLITR